MIECDEINFCFCGDCLECRSFSEALKLGDVESASCIKTESLFPHLRDCRIPPHPFDSVAYNSFLRLQEAYGRLSCKWRAISDKYLDGFHGSGTPSAPDLKERGWGERFKQVKRILFHIQKITIKFQVKSLKPIYD